MVLRTRQQLIDWAKNNLPAPFNTIAQYGTVKVLGLFDPLIPNVYEVKGWIIRLISQHNQTYHLAIKYGIVQSPKQKSLHNGPYPYCVGLVPVVWKNYIGHEYPDSQLNKGDFSPEQIKEFIHEEETKT